MIKAAALIATVVLALLAAFQILLIIGFPLGRYAWGGKYKILPLKLRIASLVSICLYALFSAIILNQSSVVSIFKEDSWVKVAMNIITGYFFIGIVLNLLSRSELEKKVMAPLASILAFLFLYVAFVTG